MKTLISSVLCLNFFCTLMAFGNPLAPKELLSLYDHLHEVNKEWSHHIDHLSEEVCTPLSFSSDQQRIQKHLQLVEQMLRTQTSENLSPTQKNKRLLLLDELREYWQVNQFPINTKHSVRQPYFVDAAGQACAVAHLIQKSGAPALVRQIAKAQNYDYVREMNSRDLLAWAEKHGFTVEELALIQPGYAPVSQYWYNLGNGGGVNGLVYEMLTSSDGKMLYIAGAFDEVDGVAANNIIAWDGLDWHTLGEGVDGEIHAMATGFEGGKNILVAGQFSIGGIATNIAYWDTEEALWYPLQSGAMDGDVFDLVYYDNSIYIGGDFKKVDGENLEYLAYWKNGSWFNHGGSDQSIPSAFTVDGKVNAFEIVGEELLIGGNFGTTAPLIDEEEVKSLETENLAFWNGENWTEAILGVCTEVYHLAEIDGMIVVAQKELTFPGFCFYKDGEWENYNFSSGNGDNQYHGFLQSADNLYLYGGFAYIPIIGTFGNSLVQIASGTELLFNGFVDTDASVFAAATFQDRIYIAGDFQTLGPVFSSQSNFNGIAYVSDEPYVSVQEPTDFVDWQIHSSVDHINVNYSSTAKAVFRLFNIQGQLLYESPTLSGQGSFQVEANHLPAGTYFYTINNQQNRRAGKLPLFK